MVCGNYTKWRDLNCSERNVEIDVWVMAEDFAVAFTPEVNFTLVVEKHCTFSKLVQDNVHEKLSCVLITGSGFAGECARALVYKMHRILGLPVCGLIDGGPHGMLIYANYKHGSCNLGAEFAVRDMLFMGLRWVDTVRLQLPTQPLTIKDKETTENYLKLLEFDPTCKEELERTSQCGKKADLQALELHQARCIGSTYIPDRLKEMQLY